MNTASSRACVALQKSPRSKTMKLLMVDNYD